jgi:uncharacterized repeat protein (TIGR01451 family)
MRRHWVRFGLPPALAGLAVWLVAFVYASAAATAAASLHPKADSQAASIVAVPFTITLEPVVTSGLVQPVHLTVAGDGSGRLFVVERAGRIRVIKNGALLAAPYLDITALVQSGYGEQGLLSVAFDPDFKTNGTFYVDYTGLSGVGDVVIARYVVSNPASDVANVLSVTKLLTIVKPEKNHNGGLLLFGPNDDYLYIGIGDGGGGGDQHGTIGNAQDKSVLLGKLLRINVRGVPTYTIPATNPFVGTAGARPEIWAYGLRNPWRFSFDRSNGDLYIGDVGQDCYEEIDYQSASSHGGENYGWRLMEGFHQFDPAHFTPCNQPIVSPPGLTLPITEYVHPTGEAVVGGYVYRGSAYPQLRGWYFYADEVTGRVWAIHQSGPGTWTGGQVFSTSGNISSFGEDENGELYAVDLTGGVYRVASNHLVTAPDFSGSAKLASIYGAHEGDVVTYSIVLSNSGGPVTSTVLLTDVLPDGVDYKPGTFTATSGIVNATQLPTVTWRSSVTDAFPVTLTFAVTVSASSTLAVKNTVVIDPLVSPPLERSAVIIVDPYKVYLPIVLRDG